MTDIFISYAREDRARIKPIAKALEEEGWSVFWDRTIPTGKTWRKVIGTALEVARSVIVAWSKASIDSTWVQEEADRGLERNILFPILIDNVKPPLGFGSVQAVNLISWESTQPSPEFEKLISDLRSLLVSSPLKVKDIPQKYNKKEQKPKVEVEEQKKTQLEAPVLKESLLNLIPGTTKRILIWNEIEGASGYILERAEDNIFLSAKEVYNGVNTSYEDSVFIDPKNPLRVDYYRVKARGGKMHSDSPWSYVTENNK